MQCPKCQTEIPEPPSLCPVCGNTLQKDFKKKSLNIARLSYILGILSVITIFLPILIVIFTTNSKFTITIDPLTIISIVFCSGIPLGFGAILLGWKHSRNPRVKAGMVIGFLVILLDTFILIQFNSVSGGHSKVSRAKAEIQSLATALESYYIDNNCYPQPDYDENGKPIIPRALTTPIAFITSLFHDPYKYEGKGYYEYGTDGQNWIVTSYGPDQVDGIGSIPLIEEKAVTNKTLGFSLEGSGLTYDPSNGITSPGDVWRRGP